MSKHLHFKQYNFELLEKDNCFKLHFLTNKKPYYALFDLEDLDFIKSLIQCYSLHYDKGGRLVCINKKNKHTVSHLITNQKIIYYINGDKCDLRKNNLTTNIKEIIGFMEKCSRNFNKQDKELFYKNMKKRYCKDYSKKLSYTKAGENNPITKLSYDNVKQIRIDWDKSRIPVTLVMG